MITIVLVLVGATWLIAQVISEQIKDADKAFEFNSVKNMEDTIK
ncbi:MAG: hypothetical protein U9Q85_00695 [Patescibacteria group bacterium]|nr:hypothetical protein [Patescibacteria group bacterium]